MDILKLKDFSDLSITQRRLIITHLPGDWHARTRFGEEVFCFLCHGNGVVGAVEHLKPQIALLDGKVANLTEITRDNDRALRFRVIGLLIY